MTEASDLELKVAAATARTALARVNDFIGFPADDAAAIDRVDSILNTIVSDPDYFPEDVSRRGQGQG